MKWPVAPCLAVALLFCGPRTATAQDPADVRDDSQANVSTDRIATLDVSDLRDYDAPPPVVRRLLARALALTKLNLAYRYGSSDPATGGMDCSGTIYHLLQQDGVKDTPRDSSEMYRWVWTQGRFHAVVSSNPDSFELARLKPGDLLFWTGTYHVTRDPPVTHVMIYLGVDRHNGRRVMMGASEGRRFNGIPRYGVSVFDFTIPRADTSLGENPGAASDSPSRFIGYGAIPGLEESTASPHASDPANE
jgi:hypothetical protein